MEELRKLRLDAVRKAHPSLSANEAETRAMEELQKAVQGFRELQPGFCLVTEATETALAEGKTIEDAATRIRVTMGYVDESEFNLPEDMQLLLQNHKAGRLTPVQTELLAQMTDSFWEAVKRWASLEGPRLAEIEAERLRPSEETVQAKEPVAAKPASEVPAKSDAPFPPFEDEPEIDEQAKAQMAVEDKKVEAILNEFRPDKLGIFARFEPREDGTMTAFLNAGATPELSTNWTREVTLSHGNGIPLIKLDCEWTVEKVDASEGKLLENIEQGTGYRLHTLKPVAASIGRFESPVWEVLWSEDGNDLYVHAAKGDLLKIDTRQWRIELAVRPRAGIRGMAWSSQGLIVLHYNSQSSRDLHRAEPWVMIEPDADNRDGFAAWRLLVLDPATLDIRRAYRVDANWVAGHPDRDLVYLHQVRRGRLLVVNVATGELVNALRDNAIRPRKETGDVLATGGRQRRRFPFGALTVIHNGRALLSTPQPPLGGSQFHRFRLWGPHVVCEQAGWNMPTSGKAPIKPSADGQFLCVPFQLHGRRYTLIRSDDFDTCAGWVECPSRMFNRFAVDPISNSAVLAESDQKNAQLHILLGDKSTVIELENQVVSDVRANPQGRGFLVFTDAGTHWVEITAPAKQSPFERAYSDVLPIAECKTKPVVPQDPLKAAPDRDNIPTIPLYPKALVWASDGSAFYALADRSLAVHRFDAKTNTETHRFEIPKTEFTGPGIFPTIFATESGLLLDHTYAKRLVLLDFGTLEPLWELDRDYAVEPYGHPDHGLLAAESDRGIVVFDAKSGRVHARALELEICKQWPEGVVKRVRVLGFASDGHSIECYGDRTAVFRVEGTRLKLVESGKRNHGPIPKWVHGRFESPRYRPQGFEYRIHERDETLMVFDRNSEQAFCPNKPRRVKLIAPHPKDPNVVLAGGGKIHVVTLKLKVE